MAIVRAVKSGNWSDTTVWNTGALPTAADDVYSNTFTVTIDQSATVLQISNAATTGVTVGGGFTMSAGGYTLTAAVNNGTVSSSACLTVSNSTGTVAIVVGNVQGGGNQSRGIIFSGTGTLNVTGNSTGGNATNSKGIEVTGTGTCNVTGNCTGGSGPTSHGIDNTTTGIVNITGNCTGGSGTTSNGAINSSTGTLVHIGTAQASTTNAAIGLGAAGQITTLTGPLLSTTTAQGTAAASGVNPCVAFRWFPADTALSTFSYSMRGATVSGGIRPERVMYLPDAYASGQPTPANVRSGTIYGPGNVFTGTCAVPAAGSVALGVPVDNTTGTATLTAANIRSAVGLASANLDTQLAAKPSAADVATAVRSELATELARLDAAISTRLAASGYTTPPTASAIATAVNSALDRTGFSLTSAERSAIATAVEQSILNENDGQAILNAIVGAIGNQNIDQVALVAAIRADLERSGGTLATRSTLTAAQVRTELAPELGNLDATVSSRLPSSGYTSPPSAASIATAVWSAATRTLTTAIDNSSTIAAAVWSAVSRTITGGTVDTLTNAPDVPTEGEIADAVRTELTPELARLSNAATTQEVGDIVEGALGD